MRDPIDGIVEILRDARRVLVITGAGISADSGLPTYRGVGGLYDDAETEEGVAIEVALSGPMFTARPSLTWRHIHQIEAACRGAEPNVGHHVLAAWQARFDEVCILTQNVDGFHRAAGSTDVIDIHGDLHDLLCTACAWRDHVEDYSGLAPVPRCPQCGQVIRPDVVLFGELLDTDKVAALHRRPAEGFDCVFSVGTSSLFPYIVAPVIEAAQAGVPTVEINPGQTDVTPLVKHRLQLGAADAFRRLDDALAG